MSVLWTMDFNSLVAYVYFWCFSNKGYKEKAIKRGQHYELKVCWSNDVAMPANIYRDRNLWQSSIISCCLIKDPYLCRRNRVICNDQRQSLLSGILVGFFSRKRCWYLSQSCFSDSSVEVSCHDFIVLLFPVEMSEEEGCDATSPPNVVLAKWYWRALAEDFICNCHICCRGFLCTFGSFTWPLFSNK